MAPFSETKFFKQNIDKTVSGKQINDITNNGTFYMCISSEPFHKLSLTTCRPGLNINHSDSLNLDGFTVYDEKTIAEFDRLYYGRQLANIKIPDDAKCVPDEFGGIDCDKFFVTSITLTREHELLKKVIFSFEIRRQWIYFIIKNVSTI